MKKLVGTVLAIGIASTIGLAAASSASAANSYVYQGSCGSGCFKYSNGSQNYYTDRWRGITFNAR
ncbi:hypothetical protein [Psychromicrobium sp. YIM B11713]|uniref:hypothetical protein n=1 Tax=Psychromicrobium sp. YIM B11713 TaxID=3145233 RepID=UPI00374F5B32